MAEVIVNKKIVVSAEDRATSVIARTNQVIEELNQKISSLGGKFNAAGADQNAFKTALSETRASLDETNKKFQELNDKIDDIKSPKPIKPSVDTNEAKDELKGLNGALNATKKAGSRLKDFIAGNLIANGIQSATASVKQFAMQGFQAAEAGEQTVARWKSLGMTASDIKTVGAAVVSLKENTNLSGAAAGNLVTRFYGLTGSAEQATALAKGVGSITDSLRLSGDASDAFANGLTRIESAGKVTTQSLGRLEKQAPGITTALQKASGMSKQAFNDLLSSGKMTSDQFNQILEKASKDYQKNADSWIKTSQGAEKNIKETWAQDWKSAMAPLTEDSGGAFNALAKSLKTLEPQFTQLGEAVAKMATEFAKWLTPQHAKDLGTIVGSLGRMAIVLGKGVWKAVTLPLEIIGKFIQLVSGKHGDALDAVATTLDHISKNKAIMGVLEGVGMILATQFAYSKLFKYAKGLGLVSESLGKITHLHFSGHLLGDLWKDLKELPKLKNIKIDPSKWFKGGTNWAKSLFKPAADEALKYGDTAGGNFITRFAAKTNSSKLAMIGRSLGGRIISGVGLAIEAADFVKDIAGAFTTHNGTTRSRDVGKAAGAGIGTGIGLFFGGPAGAALGGLIGRAIGGKIGPAVGKFGSGIGKVLTDIFVKHDWNKVWSDIGKGWQSFWRGMGNWWDKTIGKKTSKPDKSKAKEPSQKEIKSLGGNRYSKNDIANIKQMNRAVEAYTNTLKRLKQVVKKDDPTKQLRNMSKEFKAVNPAIQRSAKYWKSLYKPLETSTKSFRLFTKALSDFKEKNNPIDKLNKSLETLTKTVHKEQFGKELAKQMSLADKSMSGKHSFVGRFQTMTHQVESSLRSFSRIFDRDWKETWDNLNRYPSRGLSRVNSTVTSRFNSIRSRENSFTHGFLSSWKSWVNNVVSAMQSGFGKLPGIARKAMSGIVSRLNSGISAINSVISDFGGDKRLSTIHYARGTFAHPGGKAIVNDGLEPNKTELIWQPSKGWGTAQGQYVARDLEAGSMVLDAGHSAPYLAGNDLPHYAGGTLSEDEQDKLAEEFINNPVKASRDLVLKVTNWNSSTPIVPSLGKATAIGFSRGIANVLKDLLGIIKEPVNGDWTPVIKSAARLLHFHISAGQIAKLLRQIQTESGGREKITQQISDVNSAAGNPAQGLLQFIPQTFNTWAIAGHHNIMSGFDQILAAINALNHGGEGGWGNIGNGHGWASGVHMTHRDLAWIGDNAEHDEYVINPYNANSLPLMQEAWSKMANNHPEWRNNQSASDNSQVISMLHSVIDAIQDINLQPVAFVEDAAKPINKYNAMNFARQRR